MSQPIMTLLATLLVSLTLLTRNELRSSAWALMNETDNELACSVEQIDELGPECRLLEVYNQLQLDKMDIKETLWMSRHCACRLANLAWESAYDDHPATRRVENMVSRAINNETHRDKYPVFLWSDIEVVIDGVSIYVSTKDYFEKRNKNASWAPMPPEQMRRDPAMRDIRYVCYKIARDRLHLYQYLENLERIDPVAFFKLLHVNQVIDLVYQASKACKMLLIHRLREFKLKPDSREFYAVEGTDLRDNELDSFNMVQVHDIDMALKDSSLWLMKCHHWQESKLTLAQLQLECPMMMAATTPSDWILQHPLPSDRAHLALRCGCQLLLHNGTWNELIQDRNLDVMNKALTSYMNAHRLDNLNSETPLFTMYAWFNELMQQFEKNRKLSVKEIIKLKQGKRDPTEPINKLTGDEDEALELLRLGCNRLMYSHAKGNQAAARTDDVKLIRYLDNLRYVSQDPMFVFHLTLQDVNLFKLHALSRMCQPIIS